MLQETMQTLYHIIGKMTLSQLRLLMDMPDCLTYFFNQWIHYEDGSAWEMEEMIWDKINECEETKWNLKTL